MTKTTSIDVTSNDSEFLWSQKYRPTTVADCILPEDKKQFFLNLVESGELPNILLSGGAGQGKTTVAKALCNDIGADTLFINASDDNGIDVLRNKIKQFASTVSFNDEGKHKVVILDESDALSVNLQSGLRAFIEEFSSNCRFILTCNFKNRIIEPLRNSRFTTVDFVTQDFMTPKLMKQMLGRLTTILDMEGITYERAVVAELLKKNAPDFRRTIQELQKYVIQSGADKRIDTGILGQSSQSGFDLDIKRLYLALRDKDFRAMRQWVVEHSDIDASEVFRKIFTTMSDNVKGHSIPQVVLILGEYQFRSAFVVDQEINMVAALTEMMAKAEFS